MENDPDQTIKPFGSTKWCEKCNVKVRPNGWNFHINGDRHLTGEPDKSKKVCDVYNVEVARNTWPKHIRNKDHLKTTLM